MGRRRAPLLALLTLAAGLTGPAAAPPALVDLLIDGQRLRLDLAALAARVPLAADEDFRVGEGSVLYVPRGTLHAFHNAAAEPAIAYAVYTPAFDGSDRVDVPDPKP